MNRPSGSYSSSSERWASQRTRSKQRYRRATFPFQRQLNGERFHLFIFKESLIVSVRLSLMGILFPFLKDHSPSVNNFMYIPLRLLQGEYPRHTLVQRSSQPAETAFAAFNPPKETPSSSGTQTGINTKHCIEMVNASLQYTVLYCNISV